MSELIYQEETIVQRQCIDYLESIGCYVKKVIQSNKNGWPDLDVYRKLKRRNRAETFCVECKATGELADPLQQRRHYELSLVGVMTYVIDDVNKLKELVK